MGLARQGLHFWVCVFVFSCFARRERVPKDQEQGHVHVHIEPINQIKEGIFEFYYNHSTAATYLLLPSLCYSYMYHIGNGGLVYGFSLSMLIGAKLVTWHPRWCQMSLLEVELEQGEGFDREDKASNQANEDFWHIFLLDHFDSQPHGFIS